MAAGTKIQHKRKAGAFVGGELAAGEIGVDTVSGAVYVSRDGSTVTLLGGGGGATNLSVTNVNATTLDVASDTGADATLPAATGATAGVATADQITKLNGIATGATANSSDAFLKDRANHTGTQGVGTITGLGTLATQNGTFSGTSSGTNTGDQTSVSGNAGSATVLQTGRTINGVLFDGSGNITVTADAGTLTGATLASNVLDSSLTSVGTLAALTVTAPIVGSVTGNAATATALQTARTINGVSFDGTANISITAAAPTGTGLRNVVGSTEDAAALPYADVMRLIYSNTIFGGMMGNVVAGSTFNGLFMTSIIVSSGSYSSGIASGKNNGVTFNVTSTSGSFIGAASATSAATALVGNLQLGTGRAYMRCLIRTSASLSDATNPYTIRVGFMSANNGGSNGCWIDYNHSTSVNWRPVAVAAGVSTGTATPSTNVVVAVSTDYLLEIVVNAAGTSVEYFVNGTSIAVYTTNIPTGSNTHVAACVSLNRNSAGAGNSTMNVRRAFFCLEETP